MKWDTVIKSLFSFPYPGLFKALVVTTDSFAQNQLVSILVKLAVHTLLLTANTEFLNQDFLRTLNVK